MKTAKIPQNLYTGAGWVAAAINETTGQVVDLFPFEHPDMPEALNAACDELEARVSDPDMNLAFRIGMASGHELCYAFSKAERRQAGVKNAAV